MPNRALPTLVLACLVTLSGCKDSPGPPGEVGPPAQLVQIAGNNQSAPANTDLTQAIQVQVQDANGTPVGAGHVVTFAILAGGGTPVGSTSATTDANGTVTAPGWKLGKSHVPQTMRASLGTITGDITATVATQYDIVVRFFGNPMTAAQQAFFENAAARLEGVITGDVVNATANDNLATACAGDGDPPVAGLPSVNEQVDDIVVYAAITTIDGPGSTLAQATPCIGRGSPLMVAYGYMKFDVADFSSFSNPQEVILHEMLHLLGSGTIWEVDRALITGKGGADPRFTGTLARQACVGLGATVTCASSIPLENTGGSGTRDFHWRDATFNNELMTGFYNAGANPLSSMTIASMADLGFVVNNADNDPYTFVGTTQMSRLTAGWEQVGPLRGRLLPSGRVERINLK